MNKKYLSILLCICCCITCFSQTSGRSRNGYYISPNGTLRIFFIFTDVDDDPYDKPIPGWEVNQLPRYKDSIVDFSVSSTMQYGISRYYQQASFGSLNVIGDYYKKLFHLAQSNIDDEFYYLDNPLAELNNKHIVDK